MGYAFGGRLFDRVILLKSPAYPVLFSERYFRRVKRIPLAFGWRITIRDVRPTSTHRSKGE